MRAMSMDCKHHAGRYPWMNAVPTFNGPQLRHHALGASSSPTHLQALRKHIHKQGRPQRLQVQSCLS